MFSYFSPMLYVQLSPERLTIRNPKTGASFSDVPEVAFTSPPKSRIVAIGKDASLHRKDASIQITNPFAHPRSMVSDFTVGEQTLKAFLKHMESKSLLALNPRIVMHLMDDPEGGFTQVEVRAFQEMAMGAGAIQVKVWQGPALSNEELLSGRFPSDGKILS